MEQPFIQNNTNTTILISDLKKAKDQYPTQSKEEERKMIEQYRSDRDKLNQLLFMHNVRAVFSIAQKYMLRTDSFDDMVMDGIAGLSEACARFDIDKDIKFLTYATPWITKYILAPFYEKNVSVRNNTISLNAPVTGSKTVSDDEELSLEESVSLSNDNPLNVDPTQCNLEESVWDNAAAAEKSEIVKALFESIQDNSNLSATDISIYKEYKMMGEKKKTLCEKYNVTAQYITKLDTTISAAFKKTLKTKFNITSYDYFDMA